MLNKEYCTDINMSMSEKKLANCYHLKRPS